MFCKYCKAKEINFLDIDINEDVLFYLETKIKSYYNIEWIMEHVYLLENNIIILYNDDLTIINCSKNETFEAQNIQNIYICTNSKNVYYLDNMGKSKRYDLINQEINESIYFPICSKEGKYFFIENNKLQCVSNGNKEKEIDIPFENCLVEFMDSCIMMIPTDGCTVRYLDVPNCYSYDLKQVVLNETEYLKYYLVKRLISGYKFKYQVNIEKIMDYLELLLFVDSQKLSLDFLDKLKRYSKYYQYDNANILELITKKYTDNINVKEILNIINKEQDL